MSPILLWHDFVIGPSDSAWSCVLRRSSAGKLCSAPWWKMDEEAVRHENGREEKAFFHVEPVVFAYYLCSWF